MGSKERVTEYLTSSRIPVEVREFGESTKNSELAATALGCTVAEIAKSVVFVGKTTAVVVISGDKRVDPGRLSRHLGDSLRIANPAEVREKTGYPVGGVPPFPHAPGVLVLPDVSLTRFVKVWAAAGTPNAVFAIRTDDLLRLARGGPFSLAAE